jgi:hypothetical protein
MENTKDLKKRSRRRTIKVYNKPSPLRKVESASQFLPRVKKSLSPIAEESSKGKGKAKSASPKSASPKTSSAKSVRSSSSFSSAKSGNSFELDDSLKFNMDLTSAECKKKIEILTFLLKSEHTRYNKLVKKTRDIRQKKNKTLKVVAGSPRKY